MKKFIIVIFLGLSFCSFAQQGYHHINLSGGLTLNETQVYSVAFEFNGPYYNSWELILEGQTNIDWNEDLLQGGAVYEPLIFKNNNLLFNFRVGMLLGTNKHNFIMSGTGGFELSYSFAQYLSIMIQQNNYYIINIDNRFRHGVTLGLKFRI